MAMNKNSLNLSRFVAKCEAHLSTDGIRAFFLVVYFTSVALTFVWGFHAGFVKPDNGPFRWYVGLARGAGYSLKLNTALVLTLAARLFLTALRDTTLADALPLDKALPELHIVVAYVIVFFAAIHVLFHFVWIASWDKWAPGLWKMNMTVITGSLLLVVFVVLVLFALPSVRKKNFRLFYSIHIICAVLFFFLLVIHGMDSAKPETWKWVLGPLVLYTVDRLLRRLSVSEHRLELSAINSSFKDENILQLSIPKPFNFRPGQYAEIKVPSINREWHPFTIASADYEVEMSFYIKLLGDWTKSLHEMFNARMSGDIDIPLVVYVRGPFGAPAQDVDKYSRVFLISGGIGATPFMSICKQLNHRHEELDARINYRHRSHPNEPTLDDMAEKRIRDAVKNIYDVDVDMLELGVGGEGEVGGEVKTDRAEIAQHEMECVAGMLRVAANGANVGASSCENEDGSDDGKINRSQHMDVSEPVSNRDSVRALHTDSDTDIGRVNDVREPINTVRQHGVAMTTSCDTSAGAQTMRRPPVSSDSPGGQPPISTVDSVFAMRLKGLRSMMQRPKEISDEEREARRREAKLGDARTTLLSVLHSSRVMFVLAVLCVARAAASVCGSIFESGFVLLSKPVATGRWVALSYALLSAPMSIVTMLTVVLEISLHSMASFSSMRRIFEVLVFGPLGFMLTALELRRWATNEPGGPVAIFVQYVLVQSVTFVLIVGRLWRAVGRYGLLDNRHKHCAVHTDSPNHIPDADFVWTVSKGGDDTWLRRALVPVVEGGAVRVHRYVTRGGIEESLDEADMEDGRRVTIAMKEATNQGRPNWVRLLGDAVRHTRSDGVIGIFFCGPEAMGEAVHSAAKKVETWSNLRDAYLRSVPVGTLMQDIGIKERADVLRLRDFGCRVRLVFHEENFS